MSRFCIIILFVLSCLSSQGQRNKLIVPEEATKFILPNFQVFDYVKGDLNGDGLEDALLILDYNNNNDSLEDEKRYYKPFIVLIRSARNELKQVLRNDSLVTGMVSPKYYGGITIEKAQHQFTINFWGGRRDKWTKELTFDYRKKDDSWHLILQKETSADSFEMKDINDENYFVKEEELEGITLANFNYDEDYPQTDGEVIVEKTFFYANPDLKSQHRKAYLMKGDIVEVINDTKNFVYVYFSNTKGKSTMGFIFKKDLKLTLKPIKINN